MSNKPQPTRLRPVTDRKKAARRSGIRSEPFGEPCRGDPEAIASVTGLFVLVLDTDDAAGDADSGRDHQVETDDQIR